MAAPFRVTLNYRRDDTSGHAGRLYDALVERFGAEHDFMDIDAIEPGVDFAEAIDRALASADAFICMIGTDWLEATDAQGRRRLDNPGDFVRLEIEAALKREIRVIPVLVRGAEMPHSDELPESLAGLARRNAIDIRDNSWHYDVGRLLRTLENIDRERAEALEPEAAERQPSTAGATEPGPAAFSACGKALFDEEEAPRGCGSGSGGRPSGRGLAGGYTLEQAHTRGMAG